MTHPELQNEHIKIYLSSVTLGPEDSAEFLDTLLESPYAENPNFGLHGDSLYFIQYALNTGALLAGSNDEGLKGIYLTPIQRNPYTGQDVRESMKWYAFNNAFASALRNHTQNPQIGEMAPLLVDIITENGLVSLDDLYRNGDSIDIITEWQRLAPDMDISKALTEGLAVRGYGLVIDHTGVPTVPGDYIEDYVIQDTLPYTSIKKILTYSKLDHEKLIGLL